MHVPDANRRKLDDKSIKCIFLGVSEESKAYRLYDPLTKKIMISKDVVFAEQEQWNWKNTEVSKVVVGELDDDCNFGSAQQSSEPNTIENAGPELQILRLHVIRLKKPL